MSLTRLNNPERRISLRAADQVDPRNLEASPVDPLARGEEAEVGNGHSWVFQQWFAWYPVRPEDERGIFWLETVWIRYNEATKRWCYRSFRTEEQKRAQLEREYPYGF